MPVDRTTSVDPACCTVTVSPTSGLVADGSHGTTVTVIVRSNDGKPVPLEKVQITATGSNNTVDQAELMTDERGMVSAEIASTRAETKTVLAVVNPGRGSILLPQAPTIEFVQAALTDGSR